MAGGSGDDEEGKPGVNGDVRLSESHLMALLGKHLGGPIGPVPKKEKDVSFGNRSHPEVCPRGQKSQRFRGMNGHMAIAGSNIPPFQE